jgi:DNA-binding NarL/FixJ family response regulator
MDVRMPVMDGIEATRRLTAAGSAARVLVLTTFDLDEYVYDAMRAGASGFLLKDVPREELVAGLRIVARGDALLAPTVTKRLVERFVRLPSPASGVPESLRALSERELDVFVLVAKGLSNAEIASRLVVGEATVKTHVARILAKLRLRDRVQAVVLAYESGFVQAGAAEPGD